VLSSADKELKAARESRWDLAFADKPMYGASAKEVSDRKATVVYEYIIQVKLESHGVLRSGSLTS
jgi:hypothetical protein